MARVACPENECWRPGLEESQRVLKRLVIVANWQTRKAEATAFGLRAALDGLVDAVKAIRCEETYCAADDERLEAALLDARAALKKGSIA